MWSALILLSLSAAIAGCNVFGADDCCTKYDVCQQKLALCETKLADPTDPIWLGDVPLFSAGEEATEGQSH